MRRFRILSERVGPVGNELDSADETGAVDALVAGGFLEEITVPPDAAEVPHNEPTDSPAPEA